MEASYEGGQGPERAVAPYGYIYIYIYIYIVLEGKYNRIQILIKKLLCVTHSVLYVEMTAEVWLCVVQGTMLSC